MSLPEQIQKQVEAANSIIEQHYGTGEAGENAGQQGGEAPANPEIDVKHAAAAAAPAEPATPPQAEQPARPAEDENSETYAQRWRSLQGVYNHTLQKANQLEQRVHQLEAVIANMQQAAPAAEPQQSQQAGHSVTDRDVETFGEDLIDVTRRVARDEIAQMQGTILALSNELAKLKGVVPVVNTVAANQRVSAEERFFNRLSQAVPDWSQINGNQRFHEWLLQRDPLTGITRQTYLEDAQQSHNVELVANIFNAWKEISGAAAMPQPQSKPNPAQSELEKQVAPGRSLAAVPNTAASQEQRNWTPDAISKFYDDVRKGVYKGRESERAELERDIFLAQREGRIQRAA